MSADSVNVSHLDLGLLPPEERYPIWKESISVMFDANWTPAHHGQHFDASVETAHLGQLLVALTASCAQGFNRPPWLIKRDALDHCLVQVYRRGRTCGDWGALRSSASETGDILFLDMAQPIISRADDFENLTLVMPRALLTSKLGAPERFHGLRLPRDSALGALLSQHLHTLWRVTATATAEEAQAMAAGVTELVGAYFKDPQTVSHEEHPGVSLALRESIRSYIDRMLHTPELTPDHLAQHFCISRSYLFVLFRPLGGVAAYIRRRRLARAHALLSHATPGTKIIDVCVAVGFSSTAHFSRAFRDHFGVAPREFLGQAQSRGGAQSSSARDHVDRRYERWVRELA